MEEPSKTVRYLTWLGELDPFYRILVYLGILAGLSLIGASLAAEEPLFLLVGVFWLVVGSVVVWFATRFESD